MIDTFGKIPPQALDIEKAILGALMIQNDAIYTAFDIITSESFYNSEHGTIYNAIVDLSNKGQKIDILTVANQLRANDQLNAVGGEVYLSDLTNRVATSAHLEEHCRIVEQKHIQRKLITAASEIQKRSFDENEDVAELVNFAEKQIFDVTDTSLTTELQTATNLITESLMDLETRSKSENNLIGIPIGFTDIDRATSGLQAPDLIIIAARTSMGKTALALNIARNIAIEFNHKVAVFSLEMSAKQLSDRLIIAETEIDSHTYRTGKLNGGEWDLIEKKTSILCNDNLKIDDKAGISVYELASKCRKLKRTSGLEAVIIDYIQLMTAGKDFKGNREQEVSTISRKLKQLAKELNIPIIALSQLNRAVENRGDKRPQLSDLRESGAIEQDADMVIFLHRPEYYGILEDDKGNSTQGLAEIILAKYRNGATEIIKLKFIKRLIKFANYEEYKTEIVLKDYSEPLQPNEKFGETPF